LATKLLTSAVTGSVIKDTTYVETIKLAAGTMKTVARGCIVREMWPSPIAQISMNVTQRIQSFLELNIAIRMLFALTQLVVSSAPVSQVMKTSLPGKDVLTEMNAPKEETTVQVQQHVGILRGVLPAPAKWA
jgi:hypothetical protein